MLSGKAAQVFLSFFFSVFTFLGTRASGAAVRGRSVIVR